MSAAAIAGSYDPRETFAPFDVGQAPTVYRTADGRPGPQYWQNRADYTISAKLDPANHVISGTVEIRYTNNSPNALDMLWLNLEQNRYKPESRGNLSGNSAPLGLTDGMSLDSVLLVSGKQSSDLKPFINDTRAQIRLPAPLAHGAAAVLRITYHYTVPKEPWGGRTGWMDTPTGPIYSIAQWYPRMAVYDDLRGWDPLPYLAQEFYLEYGDFDYSVTVPANWIVAGSGELVNEAEVLDKPQRARLAEARQSDRTVMIRRAGEPFGSPTGTRTWHFKMHNSRDVAFGASPAFLWDAARLRLPGGRTGLAMSVYPPEAKAWDRSTEYLKDSVERYSAKWYPFPWPVAVNVAGPAAGMEYPALAFDDINSPPKVTFWVAAHEIGHSWFPMTVGFNERRDAWMDEGFNTFIDVYESDEFNQGEYAPKRDSEYAPKGGNPVDEILPILADPSAPPILSRADTVVEKWRHPVTYFKSALGLVLLREQILGPERFDPAFRSFIDAWAFRHPTPADFFRFMDSESGEDLSWWWRGWYENNWQLDLAVTGIKPFPADDPIKGSLVTVEAREKLVMPAILRVTFEDGTSRDVRLPAETWIRQAATDVPVVGSSPVVRAVLDPDHKIPDRDRSNNSYERK
ncbi:MAG TPA: M1 family metallopeptidase [Sphingomicrobium sp.]|nr:M1 family metallopeptidase [Sphingomicrobium sp.]